MKLDARPFEAMACGHKIYELRLYDEKRRTLEVGDIIVFTNNDNGSELKARVVELLVYSSFEALYSALPLDKCGYDDGDIAAASPRDMDQYYSVEQQQLYGVLAIKIDVVQ